MDGRRSLNTRAAAPEASAGGRWVRSTVWVEKRLCGNDEGAHRAHARHTRLSDMSRERSSDGVRLWSPRTGDRTEDLASGWTKRDRAGVWPGAPGPTASARGEAVGYFTGATTVDPSRRRGSRAQTGGRRTCHDRISRRLDGSISYDGGAMCTRYHRRADCVRKRDSRGAFRLAGATSRKTTEEGRPAIPMRPAFEGRIASTTECVRSPLADRAPYLPGGECSSVKGCSVFHANRFAAVAPISGLPRVAGEGGHTCGMNDDGRRGLGCGSDRASPCSCSPARSDDAPPVTDDEGLRASCGGYCRPGRRSPSSYPEGDRPRRSCHHHRARPRMAGEDGELPCAGAGLEQVIDNGQGLHRRRQGPGRNGVCSRWMDTTARPPGLVLGRWPTTCPAAVERITIPGGDR